MRAGSARAFAVSVVLATICLAAFVTNDLALFTFVPLVLAAPLDDHVKFRILVLLALAANVGAFLSPLGNPQKILLWQLSGADFITFLKPFIAPFTLLLLGLLAYTVVLIPSCSVRVDAPSSHIHHNAARQDALVFAVYLILLFAGLWAVAVTIVVIYFLVRYPTVFKRLDWAFVLLLLLLFVDFGILAAHFDVRHYVPAWMLSTPRGVFLAAATLTQLFSDVPTAILLEHYTKNYVSIAMGTTVGAMGFIVASLANIIAVRLSTERRKYLKFHIYSLPFFFFAVLAVLLFL